MYICLPVNLLCGRNSLFSPLVGMRSFARWHPGRSSISINFLRSQRIGVHHELPSMTLDEKAAKGSSLANEEHSQDDTASFSSPSFSLSSHIISNLQRQGLSQPTEVQLQVIPKIRNERGGDLCVNAPTGSGKTLAYAVPITEVRILEEVALIVVAGNSVVYWTGMCGDCPDEGISSTSSRGL